VSSVGIRTTYGGASLIPPKGTLFPRPPTPPPLGSGVGSVLRLTQRLATSEGEVATLQERLEAERLRHRAEGAEHQAREVAALSGQVGVLLQALRERAALLTRAYKSGEGGGGKVSPEGATCSGRALSNLHRCFFAPLISSFTF